MGRVLTLWIACVLLCQAPDSFAQNQPLPKLLEAVLKPQPTAQTLLLPEPKARYVEVEVELLESYPDSALVLEVFLTRTNNRGVAFAPVRVSAATLYLTSKDSAASLVLTVPRTDEVLHLDASLRDNAGTLLAQPRQPLPYTDQNQVHIRLENIVSEGKATEPLPDFFAIERITGTINLPRRHKTKPGSTLYVQLLEDSLAGGNFTTLAAETVLPLTEPLSELSFALERGLYDRSDTPTLGLKAWVVDASGRKTHIMTKPVDYYGPDVDYTLRLDSLRQGQDTKRGRNLPAGLMAQTIVQGEAQFDPVNGIPGEARLKIMLRQDRGAYNANPILAEQTLLLRGMETTIPFSLTTDSTHFDPYAPAPFLIVSLTDSYGRVYYDSGEVRASEGRNTIQLYPR